MESECESRCMIPLENYNASVVSYWGGYPIRVFTLCPKLIGTVSGWIEGDAFESGVIKFLSEQHQRSVCFRIAVLLN